MMSIINSVSGYRPEDKLLAIYAVCETCMNYAQTTMDVTRHDLCQLLDNMDAERDKKTLISQRTIERIMKDD